MISKNIFDRAGSKAAFLALTFVVFSILLPSCSGDKTDVSELLSTVPADASAVAAVNVKSIVEKAGCKIDGSKIVPGKEVGELMKSKATDPEGARVQAIFAGDSGIDPSAAVFFIEGTDYYITGFLADPEKFRKFVADNCGEQFVEEKGVSKCSNIAMKGNQFWIRASHRNDIETDQIDRFSSLSERLSFMSNAYAQNLSSINHDIEGWGNISSLYTASGMSFQEKTVAGLGLGILFSDAQDMSFSSDFNDGSFTCSLQVLNSKGVPAKFNLPAERIDPSVVGGIAKSADMVIAMAISPKLVEQLKKEAGNSNIPGSESVLSALASLDGTCALAGDSTNIAGILSTNGESVADISDMISSCLGATVTKDGKTLRFAKGDDVSGTLELSEVSKWFKGAMIGVSVSGYTKGWTGTMPISSLSAAMVPDNGSMQVEMEVRSAYPKENILISILKNLK